MLLNNKNQFYHPEGYLKKNGNKFEYVYNHTDQFDSRGMNFKKVYTEVTRAQRRVRFAYLDKNGDGLIKDYQGRECTYTVLSSSCTGTINEILEENNYYPFGLKHKGYNDYPNGSERNGYKYQYNGKEFQNELNLNLYDYHSRLYDPAIGRMMQIDPHAENWTPLNPYNYTLNNPTNFVDPDGKDARISFSVDKDGNISITISSTIHTYGADSKNQNEDLNAFADNIRGQMKSFEQEDGTTVSIGFDISYQHHDSKESATEATEANAGDNILHIGNRDTIKNKDMSNFPISGRNNRYKDALTTDATGGRTNRIGGMEANSRNGYFSTIHETFHFFGGGERYAALGIGLAGYETDVLGTGHPSDVKSPTDVTIHDNNYKAWRNFILNDNPNVQDGYTRIYQSKTIYPGTIHKQVFRASGLSGVEDYWGDGR